MTPTLPSAQADHSACQSCAFEAPGLHTGPCPSCGRDDVCAFLSPGSTVAFTVDVGEHRGFITAHRADLPGHPAHHGFPAIPHYAGSIEWETRSGIVLDIHVAEPARRQGIATALWEQAKQHTPHLRHDDWQTDDGKAWAAALDSRTDPAQASCPTWHFLPGPYNDDPERTLCPDKATHAAQRRGYDAAGAR